ncbi:MAG: hypothetical protein ACLT33_03365 [Lachnospira pectinoschiza]
MRLVAHMIKKYACAEKDTQDLISVGTIGLIRQLIPLTLIRKSVLRHMRQNV